MGGAYLRQPFLRGPWKKENVKIMIALQIINFMLISEKMAQTLLFVQLLVPARLPQKDTV